MGFRPFFTISAESLPHIRQYRPSIPSETEGLISPRLDTGIVNLFLAQFSATLAPDVQAVLVWDGAGYHRANDLRCPSNITLMNLPPYSPELNPVENLWHYLQGHHWSNRKYATVDDLFEATETT